MTKHLTMKIVYYLTKNSIEFVSRISPCGKIGVKDFSFCSGLSRPKMATIQHLLSLLKMEEMGLFSHEAGYAPL